MKLVLQQNRFFVESPDPAILRRLLADPAISDAAATAPPAPDAQQQGQQRQQHGLQQQQQEFRVGAARRDRAVADLAQMQAIDLLAPIDGAECTGRRALLVFGLSAPAVYAFPRPTPCYAVCHYADDEEEQQRGGIGGAQQQQRGQQQGAAAAAAAAPAYMQDAVEEDPDKELHSFEVDPAKVCVGCGI